MLEAAACHDNREVVIRVRGGAGHVRSAKAGGAVEQRRALLPAAPRAGEKIREGAERRFLDPAQLLDFFPDAGRGA